ncbi:MAG: response regulator [Leptospirillia bacterium]
MKILVVDDDPEIGQALRIRFEPAGFDVEVAHNGGEALARFQDEMPDLVILDISMPGEDGFSVFRRMREAYPMDEIPVLFLSAHRTIPNWIHALKDGACEFIEKPYDGEKLVYAARQALARTTSPSTP